MIDVVGDLWTYPADVRVITTNGCVKRNGECVMGRGCAKEAAQRFPDIARLLGRMIQAHGNNVYKLLSSDPPIYSFPVKHTWNEPADLDLIARSASQLVVVLLFAGFADNGVCVLPRPGCGNGGLRWTDVAPIIAPILDDRFHVITFADGENTL